MMVKYVKYSIMSMSARSRTGRQAGSEMDEVLIWITAIKATGKHKSNGGETGRAR